MTDNSKLRFSIEIDLDKTNLGPEKERQVWELVANLLLIVMPPHMTGEIHRQIEEASQKLRAAGRSEFEIKLTEDADGSLTSAVSCTPLPAN